MRSVIMKMQHNTDRLIYLGILLYFLVFKFYVYLIIVKRYEGVAE